MAASTLTQDRLREALHYDPETGAFTWLSLGYGPSDAVWIGKRAGSVNDSGYVLISVAGRKYRAHRDGDRANNNWLNLRAATRSQNIHNMGMRERNTSGRKGATWDQAKGLWLAQITVNGKHMFLGRYKTRDEAGDAYDRAAAQHFGEFVRSAA